MSLVYISCLAQVLNAQVTVYSSTGVMKQTHTNMVLRKTISLKNINPITETTNISKEKSELLNNRSIVKDENEMPYIQLTDHSPQTQIVMIGVGLVVLFQTPILFLLGD